MRALLLKDLLSQKPNLVIGGFYSLIFYLGFAAASSSPEGGFVYVLSGIAVGYMLLLASFATDKNDTPRFMLSLPVTRLDAVNEKFLLVGLGSVYGLAASALIGALATKVVGVSGRWLIGLDLLSVLGGVLLLTFLIPLYFALGQQMIRYALVIVLALVAALQVVGMIVVTLSHSGGGIFTVIDWILGAVRSVAPLRRAIGIVVAGAGVAGLSYLASVLIYSRRTV